MAIRTHTTKDGLRTFEVNTVERLMDIENTVHELHDDMLKLADEIESNEPLQARQSMDVVEVKIAALREYVNALPLGD
jgi:hypothetical protein